MGLVGGEGAPVGVAFSGGGVTAFLASMCTLQALQGISPPGAAFNGTNYTVALASGGTLGNLLYNSAPAGRLRFPPSWRPEDYSYARLASKFANETAPSPDNVWFGAINNVVPGADQPAPGVRTAAAAGSRAHAWTTSVGANGTDGEWWVDALEVALQLYRMRGSELRGGPRPMVAGVGLVRMSAAPLQRRSTDGTMVNASLNLLPAEADLASHTLRVVGNGTAVGPPAYTGRDALEVASMSAAFWATELMESSSQWDVSGFAGRLCVWLQGATTGGGRSIAALSTQFGGLMPHSILPYSLASPPNP